MLRKGAESLLLIIALLCNMLAFAQVEVTKTDGDQAYTAGSYTEAAAKYEQILGQGYVSAEVHYNLGNAYFKAGQVAPSILNYERALKLSPGDDDIQFNLKLANLSIKDKVEEMPKLFFIEWWETVLVTFSTDGWAWNSVIAIALGLLGLLLFRFSNEVGVRRLTFYTALVLLSWGSFSIYAAQKNYQHLVNDDRAVVFAPTLTVKSAPDQKGKDIFVIHEGLVVIMGEELNGWIRIKLSNGNVGWIPVGSVTAI